MRSPSLSSLNNSGTNCYDCPPRMPHRSRAYQMLLLRAPCLEPVNYPADLRSPISISLLFSLSVNYTLVETNWRQDHMEHNTPSASMFPDKGYKVWWWWCFLSRRSISSADQDGGKKKAVEVRKQPRIKWEDLCFAHFHLPSPQRRLKTASEGDMRVRALRQNKDGNALADSISGGGGGLVFT